jgi:hypothetical protein
MKRFFSPNIDRAGRIVRGALSLCSFIGATFAFGDSAWLGVVLAVFGVFTLFEALRGWCAVRACGIKTKL